MCYIVASSVTAVLSMCVGVGGGGGCSWWNGNIPTIRLLPGAWCSSSFYKRVSYWHVTELIPSCWMETGCRIPRYYYCARLWTYVGYPIPVVLKSCHGFKGPDYTWPKLTVFHLINNVRICFCSLDALVKKTTNTFTINSALKSSFTNRK